MGSLTYDFLSDSFLFSATLIGERFASMSEEELENELQRYRDFCLKNEQNLLMEIRATASNLRVFSGIDRVSIDQLKQSALYIQQYVIDDPLLPLTATRSDVASTMGTALGAGATSINKNDLASKLRYLKKITPMVATGFVKLLPVSIAFEPPKEIPIFYSDCYFEDALPPQLIRFFKERAIVRTLQKVGDGWRIADELRRCNVIHVGFEGYPEEKGHPYWYLPAEVADMNEEDRTVVWKLSLTDSPPDPATFDAWVRQSINQSSAKVYKQTFVEAMMTEDLGALYSTRSQLVADLLRVAVAPDQTIPTDTANALMSLELPFLRDVDIETLMRVRQSEGEAFQNFRIELEKLLRELRTINDPEQTERKAQNAVHELTEVQIRDINHRVASLREKAIVTTATAVTGLLAAVQTGGISLIATAAAVFKGAESVLEYRREVITESLISSLSQLPGLAVRSRNSVFRYKGKDVDVQRVGNDLGVTALVTGRVTQRGDTIQISAELSNVRNNTELWGAQYTRKSADIIPLQQQIAGDIAERLRSKLSTSERQQVAKQGTQNPDAYELYLKGRYSWNKRTPSDLATAISYFNQAIAKDPGYALAYSGQADAYLVLPEYGGTPGEDYPKSNAAARKALELDATSAHPHAVLGGIEMQNDWDFARGEAEFKKSFELDPNDATAHQWYAESIGWIGGREQEALAEINRAHQLDPLSPIISDEAGLIHLMARQYDEAIVVCKKLAGENPTFAAAHFCLAHAYWGKHMYPQVIEEWKTFGQLSGDQNESEFASALEQGFRSAGWKGALSKGIEIRQAQRKTGYSSAYVIASMYAELGDKDQAFRWLNAAYQERDWLLGRLKTDFLLDPIRSDPRFAELVRKVGLPQ